MTKTTQLRCSVCKRNHPVTEFWKNNTNSRGYEYVCKAARLQVNRAARERKAYNKARAVEMGLA